VTPELAKDRAALFPVFAREDFSILQESARSELRAFLQGAEEGFLRGKNEGPFVAGESKPSMADVYAIWMVKWWIETVGVDVAGLGKDELPRIWRW
jgi:glutathione S-transferase